MRYAIVIEKGERDYSAYVPDLPGCVSVGDTLEEARAEIREAIESHLEGMREDGLQIPKPSSLAEYVEVGKQAASATVRPKRA
jgi:predicted RNase H-like HicB family nuclease